ncbi:hypothetical protein DM02DRAFT_677105, partial [Periconia macrospinosa]
MDRKDGISRIGGLVSLKARSASCGVRCACFVLVALFGAASTSHFIGAAIRQVATIFEALEAAHWMLALFESLEIGHLASYLHHPPAEQLIGVFFLSQ